MDAESRQLRTRRRVTLLSLPAAILAAEVVLRLAGFAHPPRLMPFVLWNEHVDEGLADGTSTHRLDAATIWSPRPGAIMFPDESATINAQGYRGPVLAAERMPDSLRIALLGESVMFGYGVPWEETAAALLATRLADRAGPVEVFNASVVAFSIVQGLERYRSLVRPLRPDIVFVAFGNHNEFTPAQGRSDADKLADVRTQLSGWSGFWLDVRRSSRSLQALQWLGDAWRGEPAPQPPRDERDGSGAAGWSGPRRVPLPQFASLLHELADEVEADGARLVLCRLPIHPEAAPDFTVLERYARVLDVTARRRGLSLVDLGSVLANARREGANPDDFYLPRDPWHLNARGQVLLAEELVRCVNEPAPRRGTTEPR